MRRRTVWVLVITSHFILGNGYATGTSLSIADSLYEVAVNHLASSPVEERLATFGRVLECDPKYAPALHQTAKLYMSLKTPDDRWRAELALTEAMRLDPGNVDYRLSWAGLRWAQGFREEGGRTYEEILEEYPGNVRAAYGLGSSALEGFVFAKDRGTNSREEAEESRRKAIDLFEWCIELDPGFRDAYYRLGRLYYEMGQPKGVVQISELLLERYPDDKDALLLCGLGYQAMGHAEQAHHCYAEALKRADDQERAAMESIGVVVAKEERNAVAEMGARKQRSGGSNEWPDSTERARFWRKQDPLFLTEVNERRMEHYSRFAYASISFGQPSKGIPGWKTDKGRTYIKFGQPIYLRAVSPSLSMSPSIDRTVLLDGDGDLSAPNRIGLTQRAPGDDWYYEGFKISFSTNGLDEASFDWSYKTIPMKGKFRLEDYLSSRHLFNHRSQRYVDPYRDRKYNVPYQVAAFQQDDRARVEISYAIPKHRTEVPDSEGFVNLETGVFLFDPDWEVTYRDVEGVLELESAGTDSVRNHYFLSKHTLYTDPGAYQLVVESRDRHTGSIATFREKRSFAPTDTFLAMSDLMLASRITPNDPLPAGWDDLDIVPNPLCVYHRTEPVRLYYEVYNLEKDEFGRTEYEASYRIGWPKEEVDAAQFPDLEERDVPYEEGYVEVVATDRDVWPQSSGDEDDQGGGEHTGQIVDYRVTYVVPKEKGMHDDAGKTEVENREVWETVVTARYEGNREDEFTYLNIDVDRIPVGVHNLTVTVRDVRSGHTDERDVLFRILE